MAGAVCQVGGMGRGGGIAGVVLGGICDAAVGA